MRAACELYLPSRYCSGWEQPAQTQTGDDGLCFTLQGYPTATQLLPLCTQLVRRIAPQLVLGRRIHPQLCNKLCRLLTARATPEFSATRWAHRAAARLSLVTTQCNRVDLVGFLRFRMQDLLAALRRLLAGLVAQLSARRQYAQYILLLRAWAQHNRKGGCGLDVYWRSCGAYVCDRAPLTSENDGARYEYANADRLLGLLVARSPESIYLHGAARMPAALLVTLREIFRERLCIRH